MHITRYFNIRALALLGLLAPVPAAAQVAEACGAADTLLMYCSFDSGAKQVGLCLNDDTITYQFGSNFSEPELTLRSDIADLGYAHYDWDSDTVFESVELFNGDTSYEIFTALPRIIDPGGAEGGIMVTLPGQAPATLACDPQTVRPYRPMNGIGKLAYFTAKDSALALASCLVGADQAISCLGTINRLEQNEKGCIMGQDQTDCWAAEAAAWEAQLGVEVTIAVEAVKSSMDEAFSQSLQASQDSWRDTRELDCAVHWPLLFAADGGKALCYSEYTARRIDFLRGVVSDAEFQG